MEYITFLERLDAWRAGWKFGQLHEFCIYRPSIPSGANVELMLRRYHVGLYGRKIGYSEHWRAGDDPDLLGFSVRMAQARWAERLLIQSGAAVVSALVDERHRALIENRGAMPRQWTDGAKAETFSGRLVDMMTRWDNRERHTAPEWAEE